MLGCVAEAAFTVRGQMSEEKSYFTSKVRLYDMILVELLTEYLELISVGVCTSKISTYSTVSMDLPTLYRLPAVIQFKILLHYTAFSLQHPDDDNSFVTML